MSFLSDDLGFLNSGFSLLGAAKPANNTVKGIIDVQVNNTSNTIRMSEVTNTPRGDVDQFTSVSLGFLDEIGSNSNVGGYNLNDTTGNRDVFATGIEVPSEEKWFLNGDGAYEDTQVTAEAPEEGQPRTYVLDVDAVQLDSNDGWHKTEDSRSSLYDAYENDEGTRALIAKDAEVTITDEDEFEPRLTMDPKVSPASDENHTDKSTGGTGQDNTSSAEAGGRKTALC